MKTSIAVFALLAAAGLSQAPPASAQTPAAIPNGPAPEAAAAPTSVPALIEYSGYALGDDGKPLGSPASITFLIFTDQQGGAPAFTESQDVAVDAHGRYTVELGATLPNGIPAAVFANGDARWLEVQIAGQNPQPRVLLLSVPYALKAGDATTLGGLPVSAFALASSVAPASAASVAALPAAGAAGSTAIPVTTLGGGAGFIPMFSGTSSIAESFLFQSGKGIGIGTKAPAATLDVDGSSVFRGNLQLALSGTPSTTTAASSNTLTFNTGAWKSTTGSAIYPRFVWQAVPTGNNTAAPSITLQLQSSITTAVPVNTGFYFNADGTIHFASNQTFPGTGPGTLTGITAGTGLTGGGTSGNVTLGIDPTQIPELAAATNVFTGSQSIGGAIKVGQDASVAGTLNANGLAVVGNASISGDLNLGGLNTSYVQALTGQFSGALSTAGLAIPATISNPNLLGGFNSFPVDFISSSDTIAGSPSFSQDFRWQAEPRDGTPSASLNLLFGQASTPTETGIYFTPSGIVTPSLSTASIVNDALISTNSLAAEGINVSMPPGTQASPELTVQADDNGVSRSAASQLVVQGSTFPGQQLLIGYVSDSNTGGNGGFGTIQATWNGNFNTALMLEPNGGCVCIGTSDTEPYNNPLLVGQGRGPAVADGWVTYSSRRFKTNIQTLPDALAKVEKLRGVSYTLKATGKREIGVVAEEVGAVVPEVVRYEPNGKDATGVDYERLTALLIESTKQQQREIDRLSAKLNTAVRRIDTQQRQIRSQAVTIHSLARQVHAASPNLELAGIHAN